MALHSKDSVRDAIEDDIYASADLSVSMPKYKMPDRHQVHASMTAAEAGGFKH